MHILHMAVFHTCELAQSTCPGTPGPSVAPYRLHFLGCAGSEGALITVVFVFMHIRLYVIKWVVLVRVHPPAQISRPLLKSYYNSTSFWRRFDDTLLQTLKHDQSVTGNSAKFKIKNNLRSAVASRPRCNGR